MQDCLGNTYSDPLLGVKGVPAAKVWPSIGNHIAGAVWFDLVCSAVVEGEFVFTIRQTAVCASFWRAAHNIPPSMFDTLCHSALRGDATWKPDVAAGKAVVATARWCEDKLTAVNSATVLWPLRLTCYEAMPMERGVIVADISTWTVTYQEEYFPECGMLCVPHDSRPTWYAGRQRALRILAEKVYGQGAAPYKMRVRAKNRKCKECDTCQANHLAYKAAL